MKYKKKMLLIIILIIFLLNPFGFQEINGQYEIKNFTYECTEINSSIQNNNLNFIDDKDPIIIELSDRPLNQLISRIFAIFLRQSLGIKDVRLKLLENDNHQITNDYQNNIKTPTINLGIWMPPDILNKPSYIHSAGLLIDRGGRYGWFVPKLLLNNTLNKPKLYPYTIFLEPNTIEFSEYIIDENLLLNIKINPDRKFISKQCENIKCPILLASQYKYTEFIKSQINELKLYVNVYWYNNNNLKIIIDYLYKNYMENMNRINYISINNNNNDNGDDGQKIQLNKKFLILHWTPSDIILNDNIQYDMITMPLCNKFEDRNYSCMYEMIPIMKYYSKELLQINHLLYAVDAISFGNESTTNILNEFNRAIKHNTISSGLQIQNETFRKNIIYNVVACKWLSKNGDHLNEWIHPNIKNVLNKKRQIIIGGIFAFPNRIYAGVVPAVEMAEKYINDNNIIPNVSLTVQIRNGECRTDTVLKNFINYYVDQDNVLGILGPPCSETVEPIAGISKHIRMPIISYSAEGASFYNHEHPYFFRTSGDNRQFSHVYLRLFKQLNWHRFGALTEDGQKYTEYISYMENNLKENGIQMITNEKFPKLATTNEMNDKLMSLKEKKVNIIIADIYEDVAKIVMCEAYKLKMTAKYGYVWFLPSWFIKDWINNNNNNNNNINKTFPNNNNNSNNHTNLNITCTEDEMVEAMNGHFSLSHASFAKDNALMQENISVGNWRTLYYEQCKKMNEIFSYPSDYAGFAYDAVWTYALALKQLILEENSTYYLRNLHSPDTIVRLKEILLNTDFNGLSGRVRFDDGATRLSNIYVKQWINGKNEIIGIFKPNVTEKEWNGIWKRSMVGGQLKLNQSKIVWFTMNPPGKPNDGTEICNLNELAKLLNIDCTTAGYVLWFFIAIVFICIVSMASFMFWKQRYDRKLKESTKILKNFGIDLLNTSVITQNQPLDKWEIPRERVVINRVLGEGEFGKVYGGEAQIKNSEWSAVAVKTLKIGSTSDDRLNFLSEAEAMKRFEHKNIIKLLGVCLRDEPIYTIMEFMLYGDLKTYLLARRHLVGEKYSDDSEISPKQLTMMALDIVRALSYLAEMKYVHRDVACRNCLVNANRMVKLGDFGMARSTFGHDYYRFNYRGVLPIRWMAPESLSIGLFTSKSDVWSFGVLLYEMITFGSYPYQGLTNSQAFECIRNGRTIIIPKNVKPPLVVLIHSCWNPTYTQRPAPSEIVDYISYHPRLITPILDGPLASVEMPTSENDMVEQLELLPRLCRQNYLSHSQTMMNYLDNPPITIMSTTTTTPVPTTFSSDINNNFDETRSSYIPKGITLKDFNISSSVLPAPIINYKNYHSFGDNFDAYQNNDDSNNNIDKSNNTSDDSNNGNDNNDHENEDNSIQSITNNDGYNPINILLLERYETNNNEDVKTKRDSFSRVSKYIPIGCLKLFNLKKINRSLSPSPTEEENSFNMNDI